MNREKNIMRKFLSFFKKFKNTKIKVLPENEAELKPANKKSEIIFNQHKNFVRTRLILKPKNINTFLSILPFIIGFSQFLTQKYSSKKNNLFFEQNLPGLSLPTQKINWDTFQYLYKNTQTDFSRLIKNQITWNENNLIITSSTNDLVFPDSEKTLITYLSEAKQQNKSVTLKNRKFFLKEENLSLVEHLYQNLDELPVKIESANNGNFDPKKFQFVSSIDSFSKTNLIKSHLSKKPLSNSFIESDVLIGYKLMDNTKKTIFLNKKTKYSTLNQEKFFIKKIIFNREIKKLFSETNFLPPNLESKIGQQFRYLNTSLIKNQEQEILQTIDRISAPKPMQLTRLMSGYKYPDMNGTEVISYILHTKKNLLNNLKLIL